MSGRPTYAQIEKLVEFLEQNPSLAKGLLRSSQAKQETKRKWASLATTLNALGGANKDGQGWAKYWTEKKCALKKQCALHATSMRRTGGGPADSMPTLSPLDERMVAVLGGQQFATGDRQFAIDPFPILNPILMEQPASEENVAVTPLDVDLETPNPPSSVTICPELGHPSELIIPGTSHGTSDTGIRRTSVETRGTAAIPQASQARRRRRHSSITRGSAEMERFALIEERRVEAERMTAEALIRLSNSFGAMERVADELGNIANAITSVVMAINNLSNSNVN